MKHRTFERSKARTLELAHSFDPLGRRTLLTLPNGVSTEYQYDEASRLTALIYRNALGPLGDLTYTYDANGNRTAVGGAWARSLLPDSVPSATYDSANRQLSFGEKTMGFDANGNLATLRDGRGLQAFTWDAPDRRSLSVVAPPVRAYLKMILGLRQCK